MDLPDPAADPPVAPRSALARLHDGERRYFHWRGEGVSRVENFSDAVFAFALTLLVVSTEVPHDFDALMNVLRGFPAFAFSFILLVAVWHNHYLYFRRYGLHDNTTIALNNVLLLVVLFCTYPLKFICLLSQNLFSPAPTGHALALTFWQFAVLLRVYAVALGSIFLLLALLYGRAWRLRDALGLTRAERLATLRMLAGSGLTMGACALSILLTLSLRTLGGAGLVYLLLIPVLVVNATIWRRRIRRVVADGGGSGL